MNVYKLTTAITLAGAMTGNAYAEEEKIAPAVLAKAEALLKDKSILREEDLGALSANLLAAEVKPFSCTTPIEYLKDYRLEHCASLDGRYLMTRIFGTEGNREYYMVFLDDRKDGIIYDKNTKAGDVISISFPTRGHTETRAIKVNANMLGESWVLRDHLKPHQGQLGPDLNRLTRWVADKMYVNSIREAYANTFTTYNPDTKTFFEAKQKLDGLAKNLTDSQKKRHQMCKEGEGHDKEKKE